jgi:hypothetical protein
MFRAAFPSATDEAERAESSWIKAHWNISGANKQGSARFAGTWVTHEVAVQLAEDYQLSFVIQPLTDAVPDPNMVFRKSARALQQPTPAASPISAVANIADTPPVKRRREGSPAATPKRSQAQPTPRRAATPQRMAAAVASPRRPIRVTSPASESVAQISVTSVVTTVTEERASNGSDDTAVEDDTQDLARVAEQNMEEDIREQKELVSRLKAEAEAKARDTLKPVSVADSIADVEQVVSSETIPKRAREEEPTEYTLNIKEPEVGERAIVTNKRVQTNMRPEQKSLAWGALLFAAGVGAM